MMKRLVKIISLVTLILCLMCTYAAAEETRGFGYEKNVLIQGVAESLIGRDVAVFAVKKTADLNALNDSDILYVDEVAVDSEGNFEIPFRTTENVDDISVYVNAGNNKLLSLEGLTENKRIIVDVDIETITFNESYKVNVSIDDIFGKTPTGYAVYLAWYDNDGRLVDVDLKDSSEVDEEWIATIPDGAAKARLYIWDDMTPQYESKDEISSYELKTYAEETFIPVTDEVLFYNGRWQPHTVDGEIHLINNWTRSNIRLLVDGKNKTVFHFAGGRGYNYGTLYINGVEKRWHFNILPGNDGCDVDITNYLSEGVNDVMLVFKHESYRIDFRGITVGADSKLYVPKARDLNMMLIGDSITAWNSNSAETNSATYSYSFYLPMELNADFTTIGRSAMSLKYTIGGFTTAMNEQFMQYGSYHPNDTENSTPVRTEEYDFSKDKFDLIIINLGTNDFGSTEIDETEFKNEYGSFVSMLKTTYPDAAIVAVKPFTGTGTLRDWYRMNRVFNEINNEIIKPDTSGRVYFMDTRDWVFDYETDYCADGLHPNGVGHKKITTKMIEFLKQNKLID